MMLEGNELILNKLLIIVSSRIFKERCSTTYLKQNNEHSLKGNRG